MAQWEILRRHGLATVEVYVAVKALDHGCGVTADRLARKARVSPTTVRKSLKKLCDDGLILAKSEYVDRDRTCDYCTAPAQWYHWADDRSVNRYAWACDVHARFLNRYYVA